MDYKAALARGHVEPKSNKPTQMASAPRYVKKEVQNPEITAKDSEEAPKIEPKVPKVEKEGRKRPLKKQTAQNLEETWNSAPKSNIKPSAPLNSKGKSKERTRGPKTPAEKPIEANTFEKIKALHAERNAILLKKLQELGGSLDDSDDENDYYLDDSYSKGALTGSSDLSTSTSTFGMSQSTDSLRLSSTMVKEVTRCSICLNRVKSDQAVWQCTKCFCDAFHLSCITGWINKEKAQQYANSVSSIDPSLSEANTLSSSSVTPNSSSSSSTPTPQVIVAVSAAMQKFRATYWQCPNCRGNHEIAKAPTSYFCFCGKQRDPQPDPWLKPHTCGHVCGRNLECGHSCVEMCHSGRCSPCAIQLQHPCFCGANSRMSRCVEKLWSCEERCGMRLGCGKHRCRLNCHQGACPPCDETSVVSCQCGSSGAIKSCLESNWQCEKMCDKPYGCDGGHKCQRVCHNPKSDCGPCPLTQPRSCYCGKQTFPARSSCKLSNEDLGCGRTCQKPLECGAHQCERQCHAGPCSPCQQISSRSCGCGRSKMKAPCSQPFKCKYNCEQMKACGRHKCGVRCCSAKGSCPPCTLQCNRKLDCGLCNCKQLCHAAPCDPCENIRVNRCRCGFITESVPCSPKRTLTHLVSKSCIGGHTTKLVDCSTPPYLDCHRPCGNLLSCGNCLCEKKCHEKTRFRSLHLDDTTGLTSVNETCGELAPLRKAKNGSIYTPQRHQHAHLTLPGDETIVIPPHSTDDTCTTCTKKCLMGYLTCEHLHHGPCHLNDCPPCNHILYMDCHCYTKRIKYECHELLDPVHFDQVKSCKQPCPWKLPCSHTCTKKCHSGKCIDQCMVTTRISCRCKNLKQDVTCYEANKLRSARRAVDLVLLDCDETCKVKKAQKDAVKEQNKDQKRGGDSSLHGQGAAGSRDASGATSFASKRNKGEAQKHTPYVPNTKIEPIIRPKKACQIKLSAKARTVLYVFIGVLVIALIGILIYLDAKKKVPSRYR